MNGMKEHPSGTVDQSSKVPRIQIGFPTFGRILIAYDGMQVSKRALSYAAYISKISNPEIVVINVIKPSKDLIGVLPLTVKVDLEGNEDQIELAGRTQVLRDVLKEMIAMCKAASIPGKIVCNIRIGNPANEIVHLSNLMHFDLIIMGSRRISSRIQGVGSTTRKIAATLKVPILIVQVQPRYKDEWQ